MLFLENYAKIKINISAVSGKSSPMGTFRDNGELLGLCFLFVSSGKKTFNISFGQGSRIEGSKIMFPLKYQEVVAYKSQKNTSSNETSYQFSGEVLQHKHVCSNVSLTEQVKACDK